MTQEKGDRLHLRIKPDLKKQVQEYCVRNHTTVSEIVTRFFVRLLEEERRKREPEGIEQI